MTLSRVWIFNCYGVFVTTARVSSDAVMVAPNATIRPVHVLAPGPTADTGQAVACTVVFGASLTGTLDHGLPHRRQGRWFDASSTDNDRAVRNIPVSSDLVQQRPNKPAY